MSEDAKLMCGVILITLPSIEFGGYFLLTVLGGKRDDLSLTGFQKSMFRAGHAHAGVLVILALICQLLADHSSLSDGLNWVARAGVPLSSILISGGFFAGAGHKNAEKPGKGIMLVYLGAFVLAASLVLLGIGLLT